MIDHTKQYTFDMTPGGTAWKPLGSWGWYRKFIPRDWQYLTPGKLECRGTERPETIHVERTFAN